MKKKLLPKYLEEVVAAVPGSRRGKVLGLHVDAPMAAKLCVVCGEHDTVAAGRLNAHAVVGEAGARVEIEDEKQPATLKSNHFVVLVFAQDVGLVSGKVRVRSLELVELARAGRTLKRRRNRSRNIRKQNSGLQRGRKGQRTCSAAPHRQQDSTGGART